MIRTRSAGGRSSNKDLPFWVLHDETAERGYFMGVGWSGDWRAEFTLLASDGKVRLFLLIQASSQAQFRPRNPPY